MTKKDKSVATDKEYLISEKNYLEHVMSKFACIMGKTQNPNEHLHSRIWRFCSKYKNANKQILDYALAQAVTDYNVGYVEGYVG